MNNEFDETIRKLNVLQFYQAICLTHLVKIEN